MDKQLLIIDKDEIERINIELTISERFYWVKSLFYGIILSGFSVCIFNIILILLGSTTYGFDIAVTSMIKMLTTDVIAQSLLGLIFVLGVIAFIILGE